MANTPQAKKRIRRNARRAVINHNRISRIRTFVKKVEAAIEAGAEDVESTEDGHEVSTSVEDFAAVRDALEARFGTAEAAKLEWWSTNDIKLDEERAKDVVKLLDMLDDHDDIQNIYANLEVE